MIPMESLAWVRYWLLKVRVQVDLLTGGYITSIYVGNTDSRYRYKQDFGLIA